MFRVCNSCGAFDIDDNHECPPAAPKAPREYWIYHHNGTSNVYDSEIREFDRDADLHVIECSAYDQLKAERDLYKQEWHLMQNTPGPLLDRVQRLEKALDRAKQKLRSYRGTFDESTVLEEIERLERGE